jgi:hypothetical protein
MVGSTRSIQDLIGYLVDEARESGALAQDGFADTTDLPQRVAELNFAIHEMGVAAAREPGMLPDLLAALGWQGGTIHQALAEVRRLREAERVRLGGKG